jgi:signal transduction histidine kinase
MFLYILLALILAVALAATIRLAIRTKRAPLSLCLFCVLPVSQIFMLYSVSFAEWSVFWLLGLLLGLLAIATLLVYTMLQERMTAKWEEMQETRRRVELEKSYSEAVAHSRQDLEKICREFSGIIEDVAALTRPDDETGMFAGLSAFAEKINRTKGKAYCTIPVINAVLTQKENDCRAAGIELAVDLRLPDTLDIKPLHLCSIFGNMLDNAIAACEKTTDTNKPLIRLASIIDGDYLLVKVTNPSVKPAKKRAPGRHYGLQILTGLAKEYGGDFHSSWREGIFTAIMSLEIRETKT